VKGHVSDLTGGELWSAGNDRADHLAGSSSFTAAWWYPREYSVTRQSVALEKKQEVRYDTRGLASLYDEHNATPWDSVFKKWSPMAV
jgi:hypothetical protein